MLDAVDFTGTVGMQYHFGDPSLILNAGFNLKIPESGKIVNTDANLRALIGDDQPGGFSFTGAIDGTFFEDGTFTGDLAYNGNGIGQANGTLRYEVEKPRSGWDYRVEILDFPVQARYWYSITVNGSLDIAMTETATSGSAELAGAGNIGGQVRILYQGTWRSTEAQLDGAITGADGTGGATVAYSTDGGFVAEGRVAVGFSLGGIASWFGYGYAVVYAVGNTNKVSSMTAGVEFTK